MTLATRPQTSSLRPRSSRRNLSDGEIVSVPPVCSASVKSTATSRSFGRQPASFDVKARNRVAPTFPRSHQRQSPKLDARRRQDGFDVPPRSEVASSADRRGGTRETRDDGEEGRGGGSPIEVATPKGMFPTPLPSRETAPLVDAGKAVATEDDERGRKRRVVPLKRSTSKAKANTPKLAGLEIKTGNLTPRLELSDLPNPVNKVATPPPPQVVGQQTDAATTSPVQPFPGSNVPTSPGQAGVVIGPPVLGLSLAYAHAGSPTDRNHDAQLSHLLQMGVNLDVARAAAAVNVHDPPPPPEGLIAEIAQALPQALERSDRGEITPCRGRSPAQIAGLRDEYKQSLVNSHRDRMKLLISDDRITSARVASPRGSQVDLSWLARSHDSRLSLLSGSGTNGKTSLNEPGLEQQTPKNTGMMDSVHIGNKSTATSSTDIAHDLATALASPLTQPRFTDGFRSRPGQRPSRGLTLSGPADAKHVQDEVQQRRGSLRIVRDERKRLSEAPVSLHSGRRSVSMSSANKCGHARPPAVHNHPAKTIASLARQNTTARAAAQDSLTPGNESHFSEPTTGRPQMSTSSRTRSASIVLKQIRDDDLAKLQRIWSAPIDEQSLGGTNPARPSSVRSSFDDRTRGEGKRGILVNWAKLGLGWAARSPKVLADKLLNTQSEPATGHVPNTPDLTGVKSRTSSGVSSGLPTPSLFDSRGMPITPDHRIHWEFLNKRVVSGSGKSRGAPPSHSPIPPPSNGSPATRPKTLLHSPQGSPGQLVEVTHFDLAEDYFAVPLVAPSGRRSSSRLPDKSPSFGNRELPLPTAPLLGSRSKTEGTPRRPSHQLIRTASGNGSTLRRSPGDSSQNTPHTRLRATPPPPMSFSAHMAVAISTAKSRSVSARAVSSSGSTSASTSPSFDSRQAYETAKGEAGYVSFDQVIGLSQQSSGK